MSRDLNVPQLLCKLQCLKHHSLQYCNCCRRCLFVILVLTDAVIGDWIDVFVAAVRDVILFDVTSQSPCRN
jgi:hypothetical protein